MKLDSTLSKGLMILETLANSPAGKGVTELSKELELTKSNTFRLLQTLLATGYVHQTEGKLYKASMKIWRIGHQILSELDLPTLAAPQMRKLSNETGEAVYLAVLDGVNNLYIDKIDSTEPIRTFTPKGRTTPLHGHAMGKVLLAGDYDNLRDKIKDRLEQFTDRTITSIAKLDEVIAEVQEKGVAVDHGEYREHVYSIAAPIVSPDGKTLAAIGVSILDIRFDQNNLQRITDLVKQCGSEASEKIANA